MSALRSDLQKVLAHRRDEMTYVLRNVLGHEYGYEDLTTDQVRRELQRMERDGLVCRVKTSYLTQICWALCANREAVG